MRVPTGIWGLPLLALWLGALGFVMPATQAQPGSQLGGLMAPLEPPSGAPFRPPTPQESALLQQLMALAQKEAVADTDLLPLVSAAVKNDNPHVRTNALTMLQIAMLSLHGSPGERARVRRAAVTEHGWPLARDGWRDDDGVVRRYALATAMSLDLDDARRAEVTASCETFFTRDPDSRVRVVALSWLLRQQVGLAGEGRALIERAIADPSPSVKGEGFLALWMRQAPDFKPFVLAKLNDESDKMTRITAAAALLNVVTVDPSVVDAVSAQLAKETDPVVRFRLAATVSAMRETLARAKKPGANQ